MSNFTEEIGKLLERGDLEDKAAIALVLAGQAEILLRLATLQAEVVALQAQVRAVERHIWIPACAGMTACSQTLWC